MINIHCSPVELISDFNIPRLCNTVSRNAFRLFISNNKKRKKGLRVYGTIGLLNFYIYLEIVEEVS